MSNADTENRRMKPESERVSGKLYGVSSLFGVALSRQRGTALVLTLIMLTLMSFLGTMSLTISNVELGISGNYKSSLEAFYAADRAVEYAMAYGNIYATIGMGEKSLTDYASDIATERGTLESGNVRYLGAGALPPDSGSDPAYFQARYYIINARGAGPRGASSRISAEVARIVPK